MLSRIRVVGAHLIILVATWPALSPLRSRKISQSTCQVNYPYGF